MTQNICPGKCEQELKEGRDCPPGICNYDKPVTTANTINQPTSEKQK